MKDVDDKKELWEYGRKPVYGVPIDNQLLAIIVKNYNDHAVPMINMTRRDPYPLRKGSRREFRTSG